VCLGADVVLEVARATQVGARRRRQDDRGRHGQRGDERGEGSGNRSRSLEHGCGPVCGWTGGKLLEGAAAGAPWFSRTARMSSVWIEIKRLPRPPRTQRRVRWGCAQRMRYTQGAGAGAGAADSRERTWS